MSAGEFYSKGKFLLSGEYLVLNGAKSLAVPLKFGQRMMISELPEPGTLKWETFVMGNSWFSGEYNLNNLEILGYSDQKTALFVQQVLRSGAKLQPERLKAAHGYLVQNHIDFDINWGLGSSSSLVSNMAYWLDIDPFALYRELYQGSGYDVFCARATKPILYQLKENIPEIQEISFKPSFSDHIYYVHLGRKQDSQQSVKQFRMQFNHNDKLIRQISEITDLMLKAGSMDEFMRVIILHESAISSVLGMKPVKEDIFPDFHGEIKSLGAWGGDFIMAATPMNHDEVIDYFCSKNMPIIFRWKEIVYEDK